MKLTPEELNLLPPDARARYVGANPAEPEVIAANPLQSLSAALAKVRVPVRWAGLHDEDGFHVPQNYLSTPLPVTLRVKETPNRSGYTAVLSALLPKTTNYQYQEVAADHQRGFDDMVKLCAAIHVATSVKDVAEAFAAFNPRFTADELVRRTEELSQ